MERGKVSGRRRGERRGRSTNEDYKRIARGKDSLYLLPLLLRKALSTLSTTKESSIYFLSNVPGTHMYIRSLVHTPGRVESKPFQGSKIDARRGGEW